MNRMPPASPPTWEATRLGWRCERLGSMSTRDLQRIHMARQQVFVVEQACAFQDADEADERAWHLSAWNERPELPGTSDAADPARSTAAAELLAYARIVDPGVKYLEPSIGRVLTAAAARGTGLGRLLLARAIAQAEALFPGQGLRISAQHRLERFYAEAGFITVGVPYLEDDLPHIEMWRA